MPYPAISETVLLFMSFDVMRSGNFVQNWIAHYQYCKQSFILVLISMLQKEQFEDNDTAGKCLTWA